MMERRSFLKTSAMAATAFALSGGRGWAKSVDARVEIFLADTEAIIDPNIYGQFTEHIGGVIYDGVWVGERSKIPNQHGIRSEIVARMNQIKVPILRWPGGCFADSYDWKDGIGPRDKRPRRTNYWEDNPDAARLNEKGLQIFEPNEFGTPEFLRFCELAHAQPYIAANLRSLPALDFDHWVEYCNSPAGSTTFADMRAADGFPSPFGVRYWGVGNESWGCGGNFTPEEYASEFRRYTNWIPKFGVELELIAAGPNGNDKDWTHRFFEEIFGSSHPYHNPNFKGWSIHHYASDLGRGLTGKNTFRNADALQFDMVGWYEVMRECDRIEQIISDQWAVMGQFDPEHRIKIVVDEYGPWYRTGTEVNTEHIFGQQVTVRDALATALTLDAFNRNADKVSVAACAQLVNNINALFLCHEDKFLMTPNFYVFEMYAAHQGGNLLRTEFSASEVHYDRDGKPATFWGLNGSASRKGNVVTLTMVNPGLSQPSETEVVVADGDVKSARGVVLASSDMHAHNTFDQPNAVHSAPIDVNVSSGTVHVTLPPASVTRVEITLT